jgi:hypothetical protein
MGGVAYPINIYNLGYGVRNVLNNVAVCLYFKMGEIDFTPSRESLSYCETTISNIEKAVEKMKSEMIEKFQSYVDSSENFYDALLKVDYMQSKLYKLIANYLDSGVTYQDKVIKYPLKDFNDIVGQCDIIRRNSYSRRKYKETVLFDSIPKNDGNTIFFIDDLKRGGFARVRKYCKDQYNETSYVLLSQANYDAMVSIGFTPDFRKVSELPSIGGNRSGGRKTNNGLVNVKILAGYCDNVQTLSVDIDNLNTQHRYYMVRGFEQVDVNNFSFYGLAGLNAAVSFLGLQHCNVIIVNKKDVEDFEEVGVRPFTDYLENFEHDVDIQDYQNYLKYIYIYERCKYFSGSVKDADEIFIDSVIDSVDKVNKYIKSNIYKLEIANPDNVQAIPDTRSTFLKYVMDHTDIVPSDYRRIVVNFSTIPLTTDADCVMI